MPQSMAMYCGLQGVRVLTKMLPGCMSAWKKLSRNTWGEEDLHTTFGQELHIGALVGQGRQVSDRNAVDALHHQHLVAAQVPVHLWDVEQR
jgi:hypothetical protein